MKQKTQIPLPVETKQSVVVGAISALAATLFLKPVVNQAQSFPGAIIVRFNISQREVTCIVFNDGTLKITEK